MRQGVKTALGFIVLGVVLLSLAWAMIQHPKEDSTAVAKAPQSSVPTNTRLDKILDKVYSDTSTEEPSPGFVEPTPAQKAAAQAKRDKEKNDLIELSKISKEIPMKLVKGKMPLSTTADAVAVYDLGGNYNVTSYSYTCNSSASTAVLLWISNGGGWALLCADNCRNPSGVLTTIGIGRYVKWTFDTKNVEGLPNTTFSSPHLYGVKAKK